MCVLFKSICNFGGAKIFKATIKKARAKMFVLTAMDYTYKLKIMNNWIKFQSDSQFILYNSNDNKYTTKSSKINKRSDKLQQEASKDL